MQLLNSGVAFPNNFSFNSMCNLMMFVWCGFSFDINMVYTSDTSKVYHVVIDGVLFLSTTSGPHRTLQLLPVGNRQS